MIPLELVAFGSAVAGLLAVFRSVERHATRQGLETVARELGLEAVTLAGGILGRPRLTGIARGFSVAVSEERPGRRVVTRIVVARLGAIPFALELRAETLRSRLDAALGERDVATGDAAFDAAVVVKGDPGLVSGILTGEARAEAARLARAGVWVERGQVAREVAGRMVPASELVGLVGESMRLAGLLFTPASLPGRLAANARKDPSAAVRKRNLELLVDRHPDAPESGESLRRALHDPDPGLSLWAALRLGEDGRATLRGLVADARTPAAVAVGAAAALARGGDEIARDRLVAALTDGDGDARLAAAEALGEVGTTAAVTPLHAATADHPLDLAFRRAAATAIDAIQARATGAAPGQLSLAGGEAGTVSLAGEAGRGAVAVAGEGGDGGDDGS